MCNVLKKCCVKAEAYIYKVCFEEILRNYDGVVCPMTIYKEIKQIMEKMENIQVENIHYILTFIKKCKKIRLNFTYVTCNINTDLSVNCIFFLSLKSLKFIHFVLLTLSFPKGTSFKLLILFYFVLPVCNS